MSRPLPTRYDIAQEAKYRRLPGRRWLAFIRGAEEVIFGDEPIPATSPHVGGNMRGRPLKRKPNEEIAYQQGREWALMRIRHHKGEYA